VSDKQIEVLDFSRNAAHDIGKYLFSDDVGPYKAPAYEKLMINTMNMVNYLARGDLQGARIEARRLAVMQKFLEQSENKGKSLIGPAAISPASPTKRAASRRTRSAFTKRPSLTATTPRFTSPSDVWLVRQVIAAPASARCSASRSLGLTRPLLHPPPPLPRPLSPQLPLLLRFQAPLPLPARAGRRHPLRPAPRPLPAPPPLPAPAPPPTTTPKSS
jgi:hypothetical protein